MFLVKINILVRYPFCMRVRYAPSPTGMMHVGGLRTALFNYLLAKKHGGKFILRIEDTDREREKEGSLQNINEMMDWIGIKPDQSSREGGQIGPYVQTERLDKYKTIEKQFLKTNMAYPCFCEPNRQEGPYDGRCRSLPFQQVKKKILNKEPYSVRVKSDLVPHPNTFRDEVWGNLQFKPMDDFVIVRRNGLPTFHFANVIDDWQMKITHVMRGEQWLTNTNKHIYLYKLLGATPPKFVHLPLIKNMQGQKLAKRDPTSSAERLREMKYQVPAVKCFLSRLGLTRAESKEQQQAESENTKEEKGNKKNKKGNKKKSNKKQEDDLRLLTEQQMAQQMKIENISRSPVKFDPRQLDFLNRKALKERWKKAKEDPEQMKNFVNSFKEQVQLAKDSSDEYLIQALQCVADRLTLITELKDYTFFFKEPDFNAEESLKDFRSLFGQQSTLTVNLEDGKLSSLSADSCQEQRLTRNKKLIHNIRLLFEHVIPPGEFTSTEIARHLSMLLVQSPQLKNQHVYHMLRFMVMGRKSGPGITAVCALLGQEKVLQRIAPFSSL